MRTGDLVAGRFELESHAGAGGMAAVFRARDIETGRPVALKILEGDSDQLHARFAREVRVLAELQHPGIVRYVAHGTTESGSPYLAMDWLDGESLSQRLARAEQGDAGLTVHESILLATRVAEALGFAHTREIVHRDIKPGNLFLQGGSVERVQILDFGVARLNLETLVLTREGVHPGTPGYMAPEQARGDREIDARADVYSLGCVLFRCLTGRAPFVGKQMMAVLAKIVLEEAPRVREIRGNLPPALDDLVARMLSKHPARRPRDGLAVAAELAALEEVSAPAPAVSVRMGGGLTTGEQRLLCVIMTGGEDRDLLTESEGEDRTAPARATDRHQRLAEACRTAVEEFGAKAEPLALGSILVTISGTGAATDLAARAARCALAMRRLLPDEPIAVATGRGVLAERVPVGEAIDSAANALRAATATGDTQPDGEIGPAPIYLDELTAGLLGGSFEIGWDSDGLVLQGERPGGGGARTLLGRPTPCVGREREIGTILAAIEESIHEGSSHAVLLTGPAGIGKSRVLEEVLQRLPSESRIEIWAGRGEPLSAGAPFVVLAAAVRSAAGIREGEPPSVRQRKLRARVGRHLSDADLDRVAEFLGEIVGVGGDAGESVQLRAARADTVLMGDQMRRAWEDFVSAECAAGPVLLVLEDLHWGDLPTVSFVDRALRIAADRPFLVLATARPEVDERFPKLWADRSVLRTKLGGLARAACTELVRRVLGDAASPRTVESIAESSAGNAFYLEELIRAEAEGKGGSTPGTVLAMVQARLEGLPAEARRTLRAASVFGRVFWWGGIDALLGGEDRPTEALDWVEELGAGEIVTRQPHSRFPGEEEYAFRDALVREAAYSMLTEEDRVRGHRLAAEWLVLAGECEAAVLAEHYERSGEPARAVPWYLRAAAQALEGDDFAKTLEVAERGVACGARGRDLGVLRRLQSEAHRWRGELTDAERQGLEAMRILPRGSTPWFEAAGWVLISSGPLGRQDELVQVCEELLGTPVTESERAAHASCVARAAAQVMLAGKQALGLRLVERAEEVAAGLQADEPIAAARINQARAMRALNLGDHETYLEQSKLAVAALERAGDLRGKCVAEVNLAFGQVSIGRPVEAVQTLQDTITRIERLGLQFLEIPARQNLGLALTRLGSLEEARGVLTTAIEGCLKTESRLDEGFSRMYLATCFSLAGDHEAAEQEARHAVATLEFTPDGRCAALGVLAEVLLARSAFEEARVAADEAMAVLESLGGIQEGEARVRLVYAEALHGTGDEEGARAAIRVARDRLLERGEMIADTVLRESFLGGVSENARTIRRAREWLGG